MKSTVEQLTDTRVKITVEVPFDELTSEIDNAYKAIAQQVQIPGFRRGKAPRQLIDARFGRGPVLEQVVNDMLPSRYTEAVESNDVKALGQPAIDVTKLEDGKLVEFTAEVDVRPEIELPDFTTYEIEVGTLKSVDEVVDQEIESLRERFGSMEAVERAAKKDDFVTIDLSATADGKEISEASVQDLNHQVGSDELIDGLDEAIEGLKAEQSKTFTTTLANGEYKDKEIEATVTVKAVKERKLPEVDDEFAQMASEYDTVAELRESLTPQAEEQAKAQQAGEMRDAVLNKALEEATFALPEGIVQEQVQGQLNQLLSQFGGDEDMLNTLLKAQGMDREEFDKNSRERAESAIRTQLFLDALADKVEPQVSQQEFFEHIEFTARNYNMDPMQFVSQMQQSGQLGNLMADVRRGKALAAAICDVKVKDSNGESVDPSIYFGEEEVADEASESDNN